MKIVFCHNVYNRFKTLDHTIRIEKILFPESTSIIGYNVENPLHELEDYDNISVLKFPGMTHKIGCSNGCIATIKNSLRYNPDVIIFSHDDVHLHTSEEAHKVFLKNINLIADGSYDVICRKPLPKEMYGENYYMMETFCISKKAAETVFNNLEYFEREELIPRDIRGSISPEVFLYEALNGKGLKILEKGYDHKLEDYNKTLAETMGFFHVNIGHRGWTD